MTNENCPCGSEKNYISCCRPLHEGSAKAQTAEQLMRSRYCAFVKGHIDYLYKTLAPESRNDYDEKATRNWANSAKWKGLKIIKTEAGTGNDSTEVVEFVATYEKDRKGLDHHEVSNFRKDDNGTWLFVDGDGHTHNEGEEHSTTPVQQVIRESPKIGRNDSCPCGSGKKYKKCCGA